jgi:hypothetical protein
LNIREPFTIPLRQGYGGTGWRKTNESLEKQSRLILLKNPSGQKTAVKNTVKSVHLHDENLL